jgi:hypothetical protein
VLYFGKRVLPIVETLHTACRNGLRQELPSSSEAVRILGFSSGTIKGMAQWGEPSEIVFVASPVRFKPAAIAAFIDAGGNRTAQPANGSAL